VRILLWFLQICYGLYFNSTTCTSSEKNTLSLKQKQHSAKATHYGSSTVRIFDLQIYQEGLGFFFRGIQRLVKD